MAWQKGAPVMWALSDSDRGTIFRSDDAAEGRKAFVERRLPVWSGRWTIESHIEPMSTLPQSQGFLLTCHRTPPGSQDSILNDLSMMVIGSRQQAQNDSSRHSLAWNGGMLDTAIASLAQPM
jgi:hypothetical protein